MPKFLRRGAEAQSALAKADAQTELKQAQSASGNLRFWLPKNKDTSITFLDGSLGENGMLDVPMFYEHQMELNGHWRNWFLCTQDNEPCPLCEQGDTPSLVAVFSIIDHTQFTDREGKVRKDEPRLYVVKRETFRLLQNKATKKGGLKGWTVDVSRIGEKAANVGNDFDFVKHTDTLGVKPFNYEEIFVYLDATKLRELGFGTQGYQPPTPTMTPQGLQSQKVDMDQLNQEL